MSLTSIIETHRSRMATIGAPQSLDEVHTIKSILHSIESTQSELLSLQQKSIPSLVLSTSKANYGQISEGDPKAAFELSLFITELLQDKLKLITLLSHWQSGGMGKNASNENMEMLDRMKRQLFQARDMLLNETKDLECDDIETLRRLHLMKNSAAKERGDILERIAQKQRHRKLQKNCVKKQESVDCLDERLNESQERVKKGVKKTCSTANSDVVKPSDADNIQLKTQSGTEIATIEESLQKETPKDEIEKHHEAKMKETVSAPKVSSIFAKKTALPRTVSGEKVQPRIITDLIDEPKKPSVLNIKIPKINNPARNELKKHLDTIVSGDNISTMCFQMNDVVQKMTKDILGTNDDFREDILDALYNLLDNQKFVSAFRKKEYPFVRMCAWLRADLRSKNIDSAYRLLSLIQRLDIGEEMLTNTKIKTVCQAITEHTPDDKIKKLANILLKKEIAFPQQKKLSLSSYLTKKRTHSGNSDEPVSKVRKSILRRSTEGEPVNPRRNVVQFGIKFADDGNLCSYQNAPEYSDDEEVDEGPVPGMVKVVKPKEVCYSTFHEPIPILLKAPSNVVSTKGGQVPILTRLQPHQLTYIPLVVNDDEYVPSTPKEVIDNKDRCSVLGKVMTGFGDNLKLLLPGRGGLPPTRTPTIP